MTRKVDGRGRRVQVAADLRARILSGDLGDPLSEPVGRLPITSVLAAQYETTGDTVHYALEILKTEGLVYGRKGKGVYVQQDRPKVVIAAKPYFDPNTTQFSYTILDVRECPAPADVAEMLGGPRGMVAVRRRRLMLLKETGVPVDLSSSYYPVEIARGTRLADPRKIPGGAPKVLEELGLPELGKTDYVSTRPPTPEELEWLELPEYVSVLRTLRRVHSHNDRPVEVTEMVKGGHLTELLYQDSDH